MMTVVQPPTDSWTEFDLCTTQELNCFVCLGEGGQSFTWGLFDQCTWYNVIEGHCVIIRSEPGGQVKLYLPQSVEDPKGAVEIIRDYLRLEYDLDGLCLDWRRSDKKFPTDFKGIRLLRQDPLETLFAFICSQNNAISRIKSLVLTLKRRFGLSVGKLSFEGKEVEFYQFFGSVDGLLDCEVELRDLKFGYRAKYITNAAKYLKSHNFDSSAELKTLRLKDYSAVITFLKQVPGVGPKVADCVALMSLDQLTAVPIDTHIWRLARERYNFSKTHPATKTITDRLYREIGDKFREMYGELAGWAHSVLFTAELGPFKNKK